ncbi:hypothetical protein [Bradyrhizobium sp. SYSU BS000235]|uniref:hypothetical protein n=1 Tax=Bradyrhizobium sp. SYSU BS000235 TaxID=3411332 RepID=UPI003C733DDF
MVEIVARIVAIYLCVDSSRKLRHALAERKIRYWNSNFLDWWNADIHRDATPVKYWIQIGFRIIALVACVIVAIFDWFQPNT